MRKEVTQQKRNIKVSRECAQVCFYVHVRHRELSDLVFNLVDEA